MSGDSWGYVCLELGCPCQNLEASWDGPLPRATGSLWGLGGTDWASCALSASLQRPVLSLATSYPGRQLPQGQAGPLCSCESSAPGTEPQLFAFQTPGMKGRGLRGWQERHGGPGGMTRSQAQLMVR